MATKERVSSDIDRKLRIEADKKANGLGISRAKLIEIALKSELGYFNVHKENKRLTEAKNKAEQETAELRQQLSTAEAEHKDTCNQLEREKTELTEQRDEFEKLLHAETDVCNRYDEQVKSLKKERDAFKAGAEEARKQRNIFKAKAEEAQEKLNTCDEKLTLLLTRNWWERLWNTLPWVE